MNVNVQESSNEQQQDTGINELKTVEAILKKPENAEKLKNNFGNNLEKDLTSKDGLVKIQNLSTSLNLINQSSLTDQADKDGLNSLKTFLNKCLNNNEAVKDINKKLVNNLKKLDNGVRGVNIDESEISMKNVSLDGNNLSFEYTLDGNNSIKLKTDNDGKISSIEGGNLNIAGKYYKIDLDTENADRPLKLSEDKDGFMNVLKTYKSDKNFDISSKDDGSGYNITFTLDEGYQRPDFTTRTPLSFNQPFTINPNSNIPINSNLTLSGTNLTGIDYDRILESMPQKISFELDANGKFNGFDNREKDGYKVSVDHQQKEFKIDKVESPTTQEVTPTQGNRSAGVVETSQATSSSAVVGDGAEADASSAENPTEITKESVIDKISDPTLKNWNETNSNSKLGEIIGLLGEVAGDSEDIKTKKTELSELLADGKMKEFQTAVGIKENERWKDGSSKVDGKLGKYTLDKTARFLNNESSDVAVKKASTKEEQKQVKQVEELDHKEKIINELDLNKIQNFSDYTKYGINDNTDVFSRDGKNGYYFFEGDKLKFIPDLSKDGGVCCIQVYKENDGNETREKEYPNNSENFKNYLDKSFKDVFVKNGIPIDGKSITFENNKYYFNSFDNKTEIQLNTLTKGWIIKGNTSEAIGQNLQLINLHNFIKKTFFNGGVIKLPGKFVSDNQKGIYFRYDEAKKNETILDNNENIRESYPFFVGRENLNNMNNYVNYLNTNLDQKLKSTS